MRGHFRLAGASGEALANIRMHLTGYSGRNPLPPAGDAARSAGRQTEG